MKKIYMLTVAATLALGACSVFEDAPDSSQVPAQISATIGESALSRASNESWAKGDKIGITTTFKSNDGPFINMEYVTTEGDGEFTGNTIYIYNPMSITAYYPFSGKEGEVPAVISASTTADRQTTEEQPKFDFLFASLDRVDANKPDVELVFAHKMSKLTFIFKNGDGTDLSKVPITTYTLDKLVLEGTFDPATGSCSAKSDVDAGTLTMDVTGRVVDNEAVPSLIVFPQELETLTLTITDSENQSYKCPLPIASLEGGNNYQFTVKVSKTGLTVNESNIAKWNDEDVKTEDGEDPEASSSDD